MPRLNIKSTKAAFIEKLKNNEYYQSKPLTNPDDATEQFYIGYEQALLDVAKELEIKIKPEDYK